MRLLVIGLGAHEALVLAALALAGQIVYLLVGLMLVHAPLQAYLALTAAPSYIAWKLALYGQALLTRQTTRWVRTARAASS